MKDSWVIAVVAVVSLLFMAMILSPHLDRAVRGLNDFSPLYCSPWLLEGGALYDAGQLRETSLKRTGMYSPDHGYIRLPYYAVLLWPLSRLPYQTAYLIWELLSLAAMIGFVALWRPPGLQMTLLFACLSLPAFSSLLNGQDITFLLLLVAIAMSLYRGGKSFWAGAVFSLCSLKFHLFWLLPLLILGQRSWTFARGLLAGGGVLLAVSFAAAGWNWPVEFWRSASNPAFSPSPEFTPNLHGVLSSVAGGMFIEIALGATVVAAVWLACRRLDFLTALAACLAGGVLLSYHAYLPDFALLLPAALTVLATTESSVQRVLAVVLLAPPTHLTIVSGFPYSLVAVGATLLLVYSLGFQAWQQKLKQPALASEPT